MTKMPQKDHTCSKHFKDILTEALSLPAKERKMLAARLKLSIKDESASPDKYMEKLAGRIKQQFGYDVRVKNKTYPIPFLKSAFVYIVRRETVLSRPAIARFLEMNNSSVLTAEKRMEDILDNPHIFKRETEMFNQIKNPNP